MIDAYIDNGEVIVNNEFLTDELSEKVGCIFTFYDKNGTLRGAALSNESDKAFSVKTINGFTDITIYVFNAKSKNGFYSLNLLERPTSKETPYPTSISTQSPIPTAVPILDEDIIDEDEGDVEYTEETEKKQICSISIDCSTALNYSEINADLLSMLPDDGQIVGNTEIEFSNGMTAYDVLIQVAEKNGISVIGDSGYISGIGGLSEFDCGALSGWMYSVNGEFPTIPIGDYKINENDEIKLLYTCNLGNDL
jgi:hypothetical protein